MIFLVRVIFGFPGLQNTRESAHVFLVMQQTRARQAPTGCTRTP